MSAGARTLWLLIGANLLVFGSVTLVNVALPQATEELALSASASQGVVTLYGLTFGPLILLGGRVADVVGLRRCLVGGLLAFAVASLAGGLASDGAVLLAARAAQGAAGAFVAATAAPLVSTAFPRGPERRHAFTCLGVAMGVGTAASFLVGGVLVELLSWRWCLIVNTPVALLLAHGVQRTAPPGPRDPATRVDVVGALVACLGLAALLAGLDRAAILGWSAGTTLVLLGVGTLAVAVLVVQLRRSEHPLIPRRLLADRVRATAYLAAALAGAGMFGGLFLLLTLAHELLGLGPLGVGLAFAPFAAGSLAAGIALPLLRSRRGDGATLALGLLVTAAGLASFATTGAADGYLATALPALLLLGAGGTAVMTLVAETVTAGAGTDSGIAGAMVNASQQVGAALGTGALVALAGSRTDALSGIALAGSVGAAGLVAAASLVWWSRGRRRQVTLG